jgi:hypothetical protein
VITGPRSSLAKEAVCRGRWTRRQTRAELAQHLAERWCWQVAPRDDSRVARRLYRRPVVDGVYQLDEGAVLDALFYGWQQVGVGGGLGEGQGTAVQRERGPFVPYRRRYRLQPLVWHRAPACPTRLVVQRGGPQALGGLPGAAGAARGRSTGRYTPAGAARHGAPRRGGAG